MKLFLASSLDKTLSLLLERVEKPAQETKVLFIANAADPLKNAWWVDLDRDAFKNAGYNVTETDLRKISAKEFASQIEEADILHICGGSVLYILWLLRKKELFGVILNAVKQEKILYTATSAGSIITAPSVQLYTYDLEEKEAAKDLKDFTGFGFVPFLLMPHINSKEHLANKISLIQHAAKQSLPILLLHDSQAVWIKDEKFELVSVKS